MNNSTSALTSKESEIPHNQSNKPDDFITITETVKLKRRQYEVLKIICDTYRLSLPHYIQEVLIEAMKSDVDEGNFCDVLLKKIEIKDDRKCNRKNNDNYTHRATGTSESTNDRIDMLKKLAT
jgi:hypothetical protein